MKMDEVQATDVRVVIANDALHAIYGECDRYDHDETDKPGESFTDRMTIT